MAEVIIAGSIKLKAKIKAALIQSAFIYCISLLKRIPIDKDTLNKNKKLLMAPIKSLNDYLLDKKRQHKMHVQGSPC